MLGVEKAFGNAFDVCAWMCVRRCEHCSAHSVKAAVLAGAHSLCSNSASKHASSISVLRTLGRTTHTGHSVDNRHEARFFG